MVYPVSHTISFQSGPMICADIFAFTWFPFSPHACGGVRKKKLLAINEHQSLTGLMCVSIEAIVTLDLCLFLVD